MADGPTRALLFIADEAYAIGLAAALASVKKCTSPAPHVFIVDCGLEEASKDRLRQILREITWITLSERTAALSLPATSSYPSQFTWLKLFMHELLPPDINSVLYMDCDVVALTDLSPLWTTQLKGKLLAAVRDFGHPCGHRGLTDLGWQMDQPYFNSGLLLLDVQFLRKLAGRARHLLTAHDPSLQYHDQDALNLLCSEAGGWVELPYKWNAQGLGTYAAFRTRAEPDRQHLLTEQELGELTAQPSIVHFTGPPSVKPSDYLNPWVPFASKPWAYLCRHPHRAAFFQLLDATPWAGWRPSWRPLVDATAAELHSFAGRVQHEQEGFPAEEFIREVAAALLASKACSHR